MSLIGTAILFGVLFAVFHLAGWRDDTAIISGTSISPNAKLTVVRGMLYGMTYFLAVIVSPVLIIAAGINANEPVTGPPQGNASCPCPLSQLARPFAAACLARIAA